MCSLDVGVGFLVLSVVGGDNGVGEELGDGSLEFFARLGTDLDGESVSGLFVALQDKSCQLQRVKGGVDRGRTSSFAVN